jgi:cytochrome P450
MAMASEDREVMAAARAPYNGDVPSDPARQAELLEFARRRAAAPREYFRELRSRRPVDFEEGLDGNCEVVQVLTREDIEQVLHDTKTWSNVRGSLGSEEPLIPLGVDPPQHSEYRRLLDPLFSPRRMKELQPAVAAQVNQIIDAIIDKGKCDFSNELAVPLPCSVFLTLLGLPKVELSDLLRWKDIMIRPAVVAGSLEAGHVLQKETAAAVYERFARAMAERRAAPRNDLITFLLQAEMDGGRRLSDSEILRILFQLLAAGLDTVTISLECIFNHLANHPDDRRIIVEDPETTAGLVEELLRWESPVVGTSARRATRDTELSGCPIPAGTLVVAMLAAANVDPDVPESTHLDVRAGGKRHLAFGGGPHRCLGSHLARMELCTVVREWHKRIPDYWIEPGVTVEWTGSKLRGIDHLPLEWKEPDRPQRGD